MRLPDLRRAWGQVREAAESRAPVSGLTHKFYRYPARFSPVFASTVIEQFSRPGDLVLDPYMGGGTTVVASLALNREVVGCDLNSLAVFLARIKSTDLSGVERVAVQEWADFTVPRLSYSASPVKQLNFVDQRLHHNLSAPNIRPLKKILALALGSIDALPTDASRQFVRGVLLNAAQWALNGKRTPTDVSAFRTRLQETTREMLVGLSDLALRRSQPSLPPALIHDSAENLLGHEPFRGGRRADLVVTSPPYPGIHVLYHRWQVDGRKETAAPYWLAGCSDNQGNAFYNFADRRAGAGDSYFAQSLKTLQGIRQSMRNGGVMVQMLGFARPARQLRQYLDNMAAAGFREVRLDRDVGYRAHRRIWRQVPGRRWHANMKGRLDSAREVVLLHVAE